MTPDDPAPDADAPPETERDLDELADAILDGAPVDWQRAATASVAPYLNELRLIAGLADAHRNLADDDPTSSPSSRRASPTPPIGRWGGLLLLERIGSGAFGEVFRAWDPRLDREVALKLLHASQPASGATTDETVEEGRLLARVRHPNVAAVYGAERADGRVGVWTEFVRGRTLAEELAERGRFVAAEAATVGIDLCRALAAAHEAGVLHRDVKPQNIMREAGGRLVLVDFGASRDGLPGSPGQTGDTAGTPLYVAPELWRGEAATPRSDVYSVGVLLFHLVTGTYPTPGETLADVRDAHLQRRPARRLSTERPDLPAAFVRVVERAIAGNPEERYADASSLESALVAARGDPDRRSRRAWIAAALIILTAVAGFLAYQAGTAPGRIGEAPTTVETTQITFRVPEDPIRLPAISPDGRLLALLDDTGLWVQTMTGGEQSRVPVPIEPADILDLAWQHDSAGLFVATRDGIWRTPLGSASAVRILTSGARMVVSPDGRWIAMFDSGRWIRVATTNGDDERVIVGPEADTTFGRPAWSPDGRRVAFLVTRQQPRRRTSIETRRLDGSDPTVVLEGNTGWLVAWAPDGRMLLSRAQPPPKQRFGDLWAVAVDANGRRVGEPVRRVHGVDLAFARPSITADGTSLIFLSSRWNIQTHTAAFGPERPSLGEFRRAVHEQFLNWPDAWTPDGAGLVLQMQRETWGSVYRQLLGRMRPEPLFPPSISGVDQAALSPDGRWILYPWTRQPGGVARVPAAGGEPQILFGLTSSLGGIKCAYRPGSGCVLNEILWSGRTQRFTSFDPDTGAAGEPFELPAASPDPSFDLSPDARRVAVVSGTSPDDRRLLVLDLETGRVTERAPSVWRGLEAVAWTRDRSGLIVVHRIAEDSNEMLYVDDQDRITVLWKGTHTRVMQPTVSPDGRTIAFALGTRNPNVWMLQGF